MSSPGNGLTAEQLAALKELAPGSPAFPNGDVPHELRRYDVARMAAEDPPPVPWAIEEFAAVGYVTMLAGREGQGKSLLAMALCAGVQTGEAEAGLACRLGRAAFIDAENGEGEFHRRVRNLGLPDDVVAYGADGVDLAKRLTTVEWILEQHRPTFLVLDSFRSLWRGEENDSAQVTAVLDPLRNLARRYVTGMLLLHHSPRAQTSYRGSSAIGATVDIGFVLGRVDGDPDPRRRYLDNWKMRVAPEPARRWLRLAPEAERVYVEPAEPFDQDATTPQAPVRADLRPVVRDALSSTPTSRADIARAVGRDPKDATVGRILKDLQKDEFAEKVGADWIRSPQGNQRLFAAGSGE